MQRPTSTSDQASRTRDRCGRCAYFCPSPVHAGYGICAHTNGDLKMPGTVTEQQLVCLFRPSRFKVKEFRL